MGPEYTGEISVDDLQRQAQKQTSAAIAEGQADVESAKATGASYLSQVQGMANGFVASAQVKRNSGIYGQSLTLLLVFCSAGVE